MEDQHQAATGAAAHDAHLPWAKYDPQSGAQHPLWAHSTDVASVFEALLEMPRLARLGPSLCAVQRARLCVLAYLHDMGKCNWGFQVKAEAVRARLGAGRSVQAGHVLEALYLLQHDDLLGEPSRALLQALCDWFSGPEQAVQMLLAALSHHGKPLRWQEEGVHYLGGYWQAANGYEPLRALDALCSSAHHLYPAAFSADAAPIDAGAKFQQRFAGLLMLADWIGSDTQFFPFQDPTRPEPHLAHLAERAAFARAQSDRMLGRIGLRASAQRTLLNPLDTDEGFSALFGWGQGARPSALQRLLASGGDVQPQERLLLLESDTGSGKTEAALAWFLRLYQSHAVDGLYFALPTRVAARELYGRVLAALQRAFAPEHACGPVLLAAPGYVRIDGQAPALPAPEGLLWDDFFGKDAAAERNARLWSSEAPKRFLAAGVAVGTIDQALLSALKVKHGLLRSVCLDRHLLVVDEVHASDPYMRCALQHLLQGHIERGGYALLLSATLGEVAAAEFFGRQPLPLQQASARPYPSLSTVQGERAVASMRAARTVQVDLEPSLEDDAALLQPMAQALQQGAKVLVVCNTVGRANQLLRAFEQYALEHASACLDAAFALDGVRCPHHGRFARADRERLDAAVSSRLGKGSAAGALLLIGTQTLEQSLDLDADWLITDLCPMDVLLQRIGRLHRHAKAQRPKGFEQPRVLLRLPERTPSSYLGKDGALRAPAGLGKVYADGRALECTLRSLQADPCLVLPTQNRPRVEAATHKESFAALGPEWKGHGDYMEGALLAEMRQALRNTLEPEAFGDLHFNAEEGQVITRLGDPSYDLPLRTPFQSVFCATISSIHLPARWLGGTPAPECIDKIEPCPGGVRMKIGSKYFTYTRFGLEKTE